MKEVATYHHFVIQVVYRKSTAEYPLYSTNRVLRASHDDLIKQDFNSALSRIYFDDYSI